MKNRHFIKVGIIILSAIILGFIDLPPGAQKNLMPFSPQALLDSKFHLGLDLQGGSQLDYKMDLQKVPAKDQQAIVDGVLNVVNSRVNGLGVSEPNIYVSTVGDEKHLIVELAGIKDLEEAKKVVGKTIQLEFKEKRENKDTNYAQSIKKEAQDFLDKVKAGEDLAALGKKHQDDNPEKVTYSQSGDFKFREELPASIADVVIKLKPGEIYDKLLEGATNDYAVDPSTGNVTTKVGYYIVKLIDKRDQEKQIEHKREVGVRHILVAYQGAERADKNITRNENEARTRAEEVLKKLKAGGNFDELAKTYSDDNADKDKGGVLDKPVSGDKSYAKEFEDAALALKKAGDMTDIVKSPFGFHIIKADSVKDPYTEKKIEPQVKFEQVFFNSKQNDWIDTGLTGLQFVHADVEFNQTYQPYVSIQFNDQGAKLFEEITARNVDKQVAIFVGGNVISAPRVNEKISGGKAQISGNFTVEEASNLARDLNTGAIPAPIILAGQYTIGATLGQDALTKSLWAGIIGFVLVALFMILYYRLPGLLAVLALTMYSILMLFLIKIALPLFWALAISIAVFGFLISKILNSRDSGPEKAISMVLGCFILFFLSFLLSNTIVMTLAGIAGVILSIGMAVDANILIFERVKEELRDGRTLAAAIEVGFDRAWSSIRDSNFSSLITCGILFYFGSSIIQGFAFNLAAGILVSMFTAITVTKTLIMALAKTRLAENLWLFGAPKKKDKKLLPVIQTRKISYVISGALLIAALVGLPAFGVKLGLDFTGGTLMEFKFSKPVTAEEIKKALEDGVNTLNKQLPPKNQSQTPAQKSANTSANNDKNTKSPTNLTAPDEKIDLGQPHIIPSDAGYIIKSRHISTTAHDLLLPELKKHLGNFEETRFQTVGPTVGESLSLKAILAVIAASIMIVIYIAFAFRRIPRHIGPWKFGTAAIIALLHDLGIMVGVYVYFGVFFGVEVDSLFITALLTILGFSVHDTIVVFDRIREKLKYQKRDESFEDITNQAVNETIARSINTSLAVFLTLLALAIFGSESIRFFVLSLMVGIVAGTYSSIFIASPILVDWQLYQQRKNAPQLATQKKNA